MSIDGFVGEVAIPDAPGVGLSACAEPLRSLDPLSLRLARL